MHLVSRALLLLLLVASGCSSEPDGSGRTRDPGVPTGDTDTTDPVPDGPIAVLLNEVVPGNISTHNGPDGLSAPDWIELVNVGNEPAHLVRLSLRHDGDDPWVGGEGTIEPGERLVIYAGDPVGDPSLWTGWNLDKDGDTLTLLADGATVLDELAIADVPNDVALARIPDTTGDFFPTAWTTPGEVNGDSPSQTLDVQAETVFTTHSVREIRFIVDRTNLDRLDQPQRPEVHVGVELDGFRIADAGLRLKGGASYDTMDGKPAFILDFNRWIPGTKFRGLKAIKLHNGLVFDPTRVRDHITFKLAREAGVVASRVGWAEVWVHDDADGDGLADEPEGEHYGIYIVIEKPDDVMLATWNPVDAQTCMVFEPNETQDGGFNWGDFGHLDYDLWDYETGPIPPPPLSAEAVARTDDLIAGPASDEAVEELWTWVEKDNFLTYLAWESVTGHTDGYMAPNNWRVLVDGTTHKVNMVPSGVEWTWENYAGVWRGGGGLAASWCHRNLVCRRDYAEKVLVVADLVDSLELRSEFLAISEWLDPVIRADPRFAGAGWDGDVDVARDITQANLVLFPEYARAAIYEAYPDLIP